MTAAPPPDSLRVLIIATADARGHLMRAQLLYHALQQQGARVEILTTSDHGAAFLAAFDIQAKVLSRHYAVQFDRQQNMLRRATDRNVASYCFLPQHMLRDIIKLRRYAAQTDLILNDSFHPALLTMGCMPGWRDKIIHIFGQTLRHSLQQNFTNRIPAWMARCFSTVIARMISRARASIEHNFVLQTQQKSEGSCYYLPTPIALPKHQPTSTPAVAVYLNPHFQDESLAIALEETLQRLGYSHHLVGEGYAHRQHWLAHDPDWITTAANSQIIITAPGMAGLSTAWVFKRPVLLLLSEQPEQQANAKLAQQLNLEHSHLIWREHQSEQFAQQLSQQLQQLSARSPPPQLEAGYLVAEQRLQRWVDLLYDLAK